MNSALKEKIIWAITPFPNSICQKITKISGKTINKLRQEANNKEKEWGNSIIGQNNNNNWTTSLGETLVHDVLLLKGENPRRPENKSGYSPDWETDNYIYEVKTRNWTTSGTAGEKVFGTMYKYSDIPKIYGKPLKIVCVAYQEYELTHGTTKIFGVVSETKKAFLELAKTQGVEYIKFSDLVSGIDYT